MSNHLALIGLASLLLAQASPLETAGGQDAAPVTGTVAGKIQFQGERPKVLPLTVSAKQSSGCCADGETVDDRDRTLLIGDEGGLANVVVSLAIEGREVEVPEEPVVIDQQGCRFEPHILVVPVGSTVSFKNSDSVMHNVHTYSIRNPGMNVTVPAGMDAKKVLAEAESVKVTCDIHPWMASYVHVTDASVWAVTDAKGSFSLPDVPPGTYELKIWHEKLGKGQTEVVVAADGSSQPVEVKMAPRKRRRRR